MVFSKHAWGKSKRTLNKFQLTTKSSTRVFQVLSQMLAELCPLFPASTSCTHVSAKIPRNTALGTFEGTYLTCLQPRISSRPVRFLRPVRIRDCRMRIYTCIHSMHMHTHVFVAYFVTTFHQVVQDYICAHGCSCMQANYCSVIDGLLNFSWLYRSSRVQDCS
jgi:hypothetical protein